MRLLLKSMVLVTLLKLVACKDKCRGELIERLGRPFPVGTTLEQCSARVDGSFVYNYDVSATVRSDKSLRELSEYWGLRYENLSDVEELLLREFGGFPVDAEAGRVQGGAVRARERQLTVVRQLTSDTYRIRITPIGVQ